MLNWLPTTYGASIYSSVRAYSNPFLAASTSMPIFSIPSTTIAASTASSGVFTYIPSFSSIGNYFTNMFSNFSFSSILPKFSFSFPSFSSSSASKAKSVSVSSANQNDSFWKKLGYCAEKGVKLAKDATKHVAGFIGKCARYVKNAIARCGLGAYKSGNGCDMVNVLKNNKNFKQISPQGVDLNKLPAGCVLVYGRGVSGYSSAYGHTEITTGTGKAVSDGVTNKIRKNPTAIFIPV